MIVAVMTRVVSAFVLLIVMGTGTVIMVNQSSASSEPALKIVLSVDQSGYLLQALRDEIDQVGARLSLREPVSVLSKTINTSALMPDHGRIGAAVTLRF